MECRRTVGRWTACVGGLAATALATVVVAAVPAAAEEVRRETVEAAGLRAPVEIVTDRWGISHIYAENEHDLFFAQGWAAARDRLFQFEIWRRRATGTVAEILGPRELERDTGAPPLPLPGGPDDRVAALPRARGRDHPGVRRRRQRLDRADRAAAGAAADRVRAARHPAGPLDARGGDLAPPGAGRQRRPGARQRAGGGRARSGCLRRAQLLHRRPRPDHRPRHRRVAAARRHSRPVPRAPAAAGVRAAGRRGRPPRRPRVVRAPRGGAPVRDRPRAQRLRRHRQQQLGGPTARGR